MLLFIYSATIFTGSFLLFLIQPMIAKVILPYLGGSPMVWNTAMLFFQSMLLLGYGYAHATARFLPPRRQALLHAVIVAASLLLLPVGLHTASVGPSTSPVSWLLTTLALSVGLPYFLLSANATLTQHWFAHTNHPSAQNPYPLYVTSNIASFAGLLSFPFVIEPLMDFSAQGKLWSSLYALFAIFLFGSVYLLIRKNGGNSALGADSATAQVPTWRHRLLWLGLALVPSSLLQGVTMHVLTDVASLPLLWVIPLSLYLLSFILAFSRFGAGITKLCWGIMPVIVVIVLTLIVLRIGSIPGLIAHLACFFVMALACHGRLAGNRPAAQYLTGYYLWIAFGGMLGGVFNSLLAPVLFTSIIEYPLALCAICLFAPAKYPLSRRDIYFPMAFAFQVFILGSIYMTGHQFFSEDTFLWVQQGIFFILVGGFAFQMLLSRAKPLRACLFAGVFIFMMPIFISSNSWMKPVSVERNFFGVLRVNHNTLMDVNMLTHGTTLHGVQSFDEKQRLVPQSYYFPLVELRNEFLKKTSKHPLAVVGLGAGSLACIGRKGEQMDFFEIDPAVIHVAENPNFFTYLKDCPPKKKIILGDARLKLGEMPDQRYAMIMIDAYNSDSLPLHLMTREALQVYRSKLAPGGILLFHITNRHLNLEPILGTLAKDAGLSALVGHFDPTTEQDLVFPSRWVAMAEDGKTLLPLRKNPNWEPLISITGTVWTDHYSNVLEAMLAKRTQR